jgi:SsrA-binding protein
MARTEEKPGIKLIAQNRKARHDYFIEETIEAGIALTGTEVKSCRAGKANLSDAYAAFKDGEFWLLQCHIAPYSHGNRMNHDPMRPRKLLLHRKEIERLHAKVAQEGRTLIPTRLYFKEGLVKVELGVARGKKSHDKRETIAKREAERSIARNLGRRR